MKDYWVTFGGMLIGYYQHFQAADEDIVREYMNKRSKIGCWCGLYDKPVDATESKPLRPTIVLHYTSAQHV